MLYHVPSGSKSPRSGLATGWAAWKALRSASTDQDEPGPTVSPRGLLKPVAKTDTFAGPFFPGFGGLCLATADAVEISATSAATKDAAVKSRLIRFLPLVTRPRDHITACAEKAPRGAGILPLNYERLAESRAP